MQIGKTSEWARHMTFKVWRVQIEYLSGLKSDHPHTSYRL